MERAMGAGGSNIDVAIGGTRFVARQANNRELTAVTKTMVSVANP
jgi:hypothetical protein